MIPDKQQILSALKQIRYPGTENDIVSLEKVSSLVIRDDKIGFAISVENNDNTELKENCIAAIKQIYPHIAVSIVFTKESSPRVNIPNRPPITGVKKIIGISSCKGGVGKSTITVNLATELSAQGQKVALADLDIYGPSIPQMLGINESPLIDNNHMIPIEKHGIKTISFGNLIDKKKAAIWRGPMVTKALNQLLRQTNWGEIDILLLDLPPGTGDIHLSLLENYPLSGIVLVSTPQQVALIDVEKSIDMYHKLNIPVLGIIENMSYFKDTLGNKNYIFGEGGAKHLAKEANIELLGEIPLSIILRENADIGVPILHSHKPDPVITESFKDIAKKLI
jgi:ATP-binding protein involved in chromosome partitioning